MFHEICYCLIILNMFLMKYGYKEIFAWQVAGLIISSPYIEHRRRLTLSMPDNQPVDMAQIKYE